jgi:ribulose bisphosphate carboxylase small subunit
VFRIAVRHEDADHPDAATFQWGSTFATQTDAESALKGAKAEYGNGYVRTIEQLHTELNKDGEPKSAEWKEA